ncbi:TetR family transcriptional regulator [Methylomonas koyamae]|uniref:TetR family transcriptional regulator n=1 Tax=Methylomonas koyamae TaxID=702114 RepID=UPI000A419E40
MLKPKQIKREKLLDRGVSLLLEKGYHATGLKEILEAVQIPKGSFYAYFGSKEEFAAEAVKHYIEPFIQRLSGHLQNPELDGLGALQAYYAELIDEVAQTGFKGGCLLGNLMGEIGDTSRCAATPCSKRSAATPICRKLLWSVVRKTAGYAPTRPRKAWRI